MKKIFVKTLFIAMSALILHSCELDNYDGPDATLSGLSLIHISEPTRH